MTDAQLDLLSRIFVFVSSRRMFIDHLNEKGIIDREQANSILYNIFESLIAPAESSGPSSPKLRRSKSLTSASSDVHPAYRTPPIHPAPAPVSDAESPPSSGPSSPLPRPGPAPVSDPKSPPTPTVSMPSTPRTPSFRVPEPEGHFPFSYSAARRASEQIEPVSLESPMKEPSEGDVD